MDHFKSIEAIAYAAINDNAGTVTYVNLYGGKLTASYRPEPYTFQITPKTTKKLEDGWVEVPADEWPEVIAHARPARKTKK